MYLLLPCIYYGLQGKEAVIQGLKREREREKKKNHVENRTLTIRQPRVANVAPVPASKAI